MQKRQISEQKFVFFAQNRKIVIFCRKFSRVFVTCVCLCLIFFKFFGSIFIRLKNQKAYRVQLDPGAKVDFRYDKLYPVVVGCIEIIFPNSLVVSCNYALKL